MTKVQRHCKECGAALEAPKRRDHIAEFCKGAACRKAWHNRRMTRGAIMYDMFMAIRHERALAQKLGAWAKLCRFAAMCLYEDQQERDGRKSWRKLQTVLADRPDLSTKIGRI